MERASWSQFGLVGAVASGGGLMKRASCDSFPRWWHCCFMRGLMEWYIQLEVNFVVTSCQLTEIGCQ